MKTNLEKPAGTCLVNLTIVQFEDRLNFLQGPVLGPTIGNILYNEVLNLEFPPDYQPIPHANDLALIVRSGSRAGLMERANTSLIRITEWIDRNHVMLALQKSKASIFKLLRNREGVSFTIRYIEITKSTRCLGIHIFTQHFKNTIIKKVKNLG